jgi:endoglucanase
MLRRLVIAILVVLVSTAVAQNLPLTSVPSSRLAHLRHGVNLTGWFAQVYDPKGYTKEHFQNWVTTPDLALIKSAGFDHVRLGVNPAPLMEAIKGPNGGADYFASLDAALKLILDAGLAVELDVHPDSDFKSRLNDDNFVEEFAGFWRALAKRYSALDPERLFFEIVNEPEMHDAYRWYGVETKLAAAIRQAAPVHTILAPGARWDDEDDLLFQEPLRDANVIYVFHFYLPHLFTHQGATWSVYYWRSVKGLRYPSSPENAAQIAAVVPEARDRLYLIRYGYERWDAARIEAEINQVAEWGKQRSVPIACNEFGVYRDFADAQDRAAWIKDVRSALERHGIGWTMWDYSGNFGVAEKRDGKTALDENVIRALGLR